MNIESSNINLSKDTSISQKKVSNEQEPTVNFADELKEIAKNEEKIEQNTAEILPQEQEPVEDLGLKQESSQKNVTQQECKTKEHNLHTKESISSFELKDSVNTKKIDNALEGLQSVVKEFNQSDDKSFVSLENEDFLTDNENVINNDFNVQENKELLPQMNPNMNFSGNGQPFSSFMNNDAENTKLSNQIKGTTAQDLAEEAAILSTMAENIAIANKNQIVKESRIVTNEEGIKEVDTKTGISIETIVKYDSVIMNQADVEVFVNLVENKEINLNELSSKGAEKSVQVSKTLINMIAKSMENNQPLRIDFDNNISVIIRVSRDGKITADFLPSSQVAEAYLKENLPLLRQRFDDKNIEYDSLNQRERRDSQREQNRKKDRNHE